MNPTISMRLRVQSLALLSGEGSGVAMSCGVSHRCGSDPKSLWLWCRPAAAGPILPLAWELPYAAGAALKRPKRKRKERKKKSFSSPLSLPQNLMFLLLSVSDAWCPMLVLHESARGEQWSLQCHVQLVPSACWHSSRLDC